MLHFTIHKSGAAPRSLTFEQDVIKIGSLPTSTLQLDDPGVARMHAVIEIDKGVIRLIDLSSEAGTTHNGTRVDRNAVLVDGDRIDIGPFALTVRTEACRAAKDAIPASFPAPQAVVEVINSHCPPGFSVASVGASVSLYRGASKSPFAAFSYTGEGSALGIVVAIWRIALAEKAQPVTNITNVSNSLAAADIEEMKARGDALEILGWSATLEPTAWARSYLNIEQVTLANERERAEKAESRIRVLESEATALRDSEQRTAEASFEQADAIGVAQERIKALLAGLWKLSYHPEMDLDEWIAARVKQRDQTEGKLAAAHKALTILGWLPALSFEPVLWAESKRAEIYGPANMNRRAEIEEAVGWCFTNPGRGLAAELANDAAKALQEKLAASAPEAKNLRWAMAQAMHIGAETAIRWAENEDRRLRRAPGADEALAAETATAALRKEALVALGWDGMGDPKAWAVGSGLSSGRLLNYLQDALVTLGWGGTGDPLEWAEQHIKALRTLGYRPQDWTTIEEWAVVTHERHKQGIRPPESETLAQIRGALEEALGRVMGATCPIIELVVALAAQRDGLRENLARREREIGKMHETVGVSFRDEAKNITGDRLEWEAEVLHEVDVPGHLRDFAGHGSPVPKIEQTGGVAGDAPKVTDEQRQTACFIVGDKVLAVGPRWTGITWMSAKGRAKTCRIEGLTAQLDPGMKSTWLIDVPSLPPKLWRRIAGGSPVAFHVGEGRVLKGIALRIVQGGPLAHRLHVHAPAT
jgi:hypothetical protein